MCYELLFFQISGQFYGPTFLVLFDLVLWLCLVNLCLLLLLRLCLSVWVVGWGHDRFFPFNQSQIDMWQSVVTLGHLVNTGWQPLVTGCDFGSPINIVVI